MSNCSSQRRLSSTGDWERNADPQQARNRQNPRSRRRGAVEPMSRRKSIVKLDADAAADLERVARELIEFSRAERTKAGRGDAHGSRHEPLHHRVTREGGVPAGRDERLRLRRGRQGRRAARGGRGRIRNSWGRRNTRLPVREAATANMRERCVAARNFLSSPRLSSRRRPGVGGGSGHRALGALLRNHGDGVAGRDDRRAADGAGEEQGRTGVGGIRNGGRFFQSRILRNPGLQFKLRDP